MIPWPEPQDTWTGTNGPRIVVLSTSSSTGRWPDVLQRTMREIVLVELSPELERLALDESIGRDMQEFIESLRISSTRRARYWPEVTVDPREHRRAPTRRPPVRRVAWERRGRSRGARRGRIVRRYFQRKSASNRRP